MPRKLSQAEQEQQDVQAGKYKLPKSIDQIANELIQKYERQQQSCTVDVTNRPIAEKLHTFANEISNDILKAERAKEELMSIRATLMVNFMEGSSQNHYGFTIPNDDKVSTHQLLVKVLENLIKGR